MNNSNEAGNLLPIHENNGEPTIESTEIAKELGNDHVSVMKLITKHKKAIEKDFGVFAFEMLKPQKQGGRPQKITKLNEGQAIALVTLSKNTEQSVPLKLKIAKSFLFFRQTAYELKSNASNLIHIAESVAMSVIPSDKHVFLVTTRELARAASISTSTINANKHRFKQELIENIHFINDFIVHDHAQNLDYKTTVWTQKGVIEQTSHMRIGNAVAFRDWSDLVQNKKPQNIALREPAPKRRKHNRLTPERIISIMADVSKISDDTLRNRIIGKLTGGQA